MAKRQTMEDRHCCSSQGGGTILIVDDHLDTLDVMRRLLAAEGYRIYTALSVSGALAAAAQRHFDLYILDIGLPDGTGYDILRELLKREAVKAIVVTGSDIGNDLANANGATFTAQFLKPVDFSFLKKAIREILATGSFNTTVARNA
jgi:CheY-like chemotaxis protein